MAIYAGSGFAAALAGIILVSRVSTTRSDMGSGYELTAITAVVLGGTSILGGSGRQSGTIVGTILIVLLQSMLAVMQMPEAGRQIIYGVVIFSMLLLYGRDRRLNG